MLEPWGVPEVTKFKSNRHFRSSLLWFECYAGEGCQFLQGRFRFKSNSESLTVSVRFKFTARLWFDQTVNSKDIRLGAFLSNCQHRVLELPQTVDSPDMALNFNLLARFRKWDDDPSDTYAVGSHKRL